MIRKIGIIADDLTGANDSAVQFAKFGLKTIVLVEFPDLPDDVFSADVVAVDTQSRSASSERASERVRQAVRILKKVGVARVYKKIDSTLRGNIGVELNAIMDELGVKTCVFSPAFPTNGRIVIGGYLLVNGMPLEGTKISDGKRAQGSHIPTILETQTKLKVEHIPLSKVTHGIDFLRNELDILERKGAQIIVIDATTHQDLRVIAQAAEWSNMAHLMSGSAGLAETLAETLRLPSLPALVIAGSSSTITTQQVTNSTKQLNATIVTINSSKVLRDTDTMDEIHRTVNEATSVLESGRDTIIVSAETKDSVMLTIQHGVELGMSEGEVRHRVASALGECTKRIVEHARISGLVVTGGDVAIEVLRTQGGVGMRIIDEVLPGIPLSEIVGGKNNGLRVVTKAGAFGKPDAISAAIRYLRMRGLTL